MTRGFPYRCEAGTRGCISPEGMHHGWGRVDVSVRGCHMPKTQQTASPRTSEETVGEIRREMATGTEVDVVSVL